MTEIAKPMNDSNSPAGVHPNDEIIPSTNASSGLFAPGFLPGDGGHAMARVLAGTPLPGSAQVRRLGEGLHVASRLDDRFLPEKNQAGSMMLEVFTRIRDAFTATVAGQGISAAR